MSSSLAFRTPSLRVRTTLTLALVSTKDLSINLASPAKPASRQQPTISLTHHKFSEPRLPAILQRYLLDISLLQDFLITNGFPHFNWQRQYARVWHWNPSGTYQTRWLYYTAHGTTTQK